MVFISIIFLFGFLMVVSAEASAIGACVTRRDLGRQGKMMWTFI